MHILKEKTFQNLKLNEFLSDCLTIYIEKWLLKNLVQTQLFVNDFNSVKECKEELCWVRFNLPNKEFF